ncbi:hypothetical protein HGRIS_007628 [Hohenbuehelia grisea]|uniref:Uncharacterized protein n=1 Tax=Hohenbuehelia grisea TaxID=104357 RepID=A0ABR3J5E1_9AGAR
MSPSVTSSISEFIQGIFGIFASVFNSILAVFTAILALGQDIIGGFLQVVQNIIKMAVDLFSGALGFVMGNIITLIVLAGAYWLYTTRQQNSSVTGSSKRRS